MNTTPKTPTADEFENLNTRARAEAIPDSVQSIIAAPPVSDPASLISGLDDVPEDVRKNIKGYEKMLLDEQLMKILYVKGCAVKVDDIVFGMWLSFKKQIDRMTVIRRLNDLVTQEKVDRIEGKRGWYRLTDMGRAMFRQAAPVGAVAAAIAVDLADKPSLTDVKRIVPRQAAVGE